MRFSEKYTDDTKETKKKLISKDAFAIGDVLQELTDLIEKVRLTW